MTEVGGNTLEIKYWLTNPSNRYYGICQWSTGYKAVWYEDLEYQINFLIDTMPYEFNTYGRSYAKGFDYADFLALENAEDGQPPLLNSINDAVLGHFGQIGRAACKEKR
jgi:hypothetical protein